MTMTMTEDGPRLPEATYHSMTYTRRRARLFEEAEAWAQTVIDGALATGEIEHGWPAFSWGKHEDPVRNEWFDACFGMTEREVIEAQNACVARYKTLGWWRRTERQQVEEEYIRYHAILSVSSGLTTTWW